MSVTESSAAAPGVGSALPTMSRWVPHRSGPRGTRSDRHLPSVLAVSRRRPRAERCLLLHSPWNGHEHATPVAGPRALARGRPSILPCPLALPLVAVAQAVPRLVRVRGRAAGTGATRPASELGRPGAIG